MPSENVENLLENQAENLIKKEEKFDEHYDVLHELGRGRFAVVKKCVCKKTGKMFAAKIIKKSRTNTQGRSGRDQLLLEIDILNQSSHPKMVRLFDVYETRTEMQLILELAAGGDLHRHCIEGDVTRTEKEICYLIRQITEAILYLHDLSIVHLDLKPDNILLANQDEIFPEIRLIDFGLSRRLNVPYSQFDIVGTPEYVAPEVLSYEPIDYGSDMWSIGVVTYVLLSGISPFAGDDVMETYSNIGMVDYDFDCEEFDEISDTAIDFIERLLVRSVKKRMSAREALEHDWLKQLDGGITQEDVAHATQAQQEELGNEVMCPDTPLVDENYSSSSESETPLERSTEVLENNKVNTPEPSRVKTPEPPKAETPEPPKVNTPEPPKADTPEPPKVDTPEPPKVDTPEPPKVDTPEPPKVNTPEPPKVDTPEPLKIDTPEPPKVDTPEPHIIDSPKVEKKHVYEPSKVEKKHKKEIPLPKTPKEPTQSPKTLKKVEQLSTKVEKKTVEIPKKSPPVTLKKPEVSKTTERVSKFTKSTNEENLKSKSLKAKFESKNDELSSLKLKSAPPKPSPKPFSKSKSEDNASSSPPVIHKQKSDDNSTQLSAVEQKKQALKIKLKDSTDKIVKPAKSAPTTPTVCSSPSRSATQSPCGSNRSSRSNSPGETRKADSPSPALRRTVSPTNTKTQSPLNQRKIEDTDKSSPKVNRGSVRGKIPGGIAAKMANKFSSPGSSTDNSPKQKAKFEKKAVAIPKVEAKTNDSHAKDETKINEEANDKIHLDENKNEKKVEEQKPSTPVEEKKPNTPKAEKKTIAPPVAEKKPVVEKKPSKPVAEKKTSQDIVFSMTLGGSLSSSGKKLTVGPLVSCADANSETMQEDDESKEEYEIEADESKDTVPIKMKMGAGGSIKLGLGRPNRRASDLPQPVSVEEAKRAPKLKELKKSQSMSRRRSNTAEGSSPSAPRKNYRRLYVTKVRNSKVFDPEFSIDSCAAAQIMQRVDNDVLKVEVRLKSTDLKLLP